MSEQPRLSRVEIESAPEEVRPTFDKFIRERGKVPNLYRIAAHAPRIGEDGAYTVEAEAIARGNEELAALIREASAR